LGLGEVLPVEDRNLLDSTLDADAVVIEVVPSDASSVVVLERCGRANPRLPVIAVGRRVDADLAVEIVKLVAEDFVTLPLRSEGDLVHKVERALRRKSGPCIERSCLAPLRVASVQEGETDRRHVFRAVVPAQWQARGHVRGTPIGARVTIEDIAIPHEGWPGSMLLKADRISAQEIVKAAPRWGQGSRIDMDVKLEGESRELGLKAKVVRVPRPRGKRWFYFAVEYVAEEPEDNEAFRRFWMDCQTRAVESDPERTPKPGGRDPTRR